VNGGLATAVVVIGLIAMAALVVGIIGLTRPTQTTAGDRVVSPPTAAPTFTPDQIASAKKNLCSVYQVAAKSVQVDTNATDVAIARVAVANAAGMLDDAVDNPALGGSERDAARTLASAYRNVNAISSVFDKTSPVFQSALDDVNRADAVMAAMCP
jgi:hypothetical protein